MQLSELAGHVVSFAPLVDITSAIGFDQKISNTRSSMRRGLPLALDLPKADEQEIAIVSGGSSLTSFLSLVSTFPAIMVCGSAHNYLIRCGIIPTYCIILDASPDAADLIHPHVDVKYLVASSCDPATFDIMSAYQTYIWHSAGEVPYVLLEGQDAVGGGSSVTLRAIGLAQILGYSQQHFFGLDSCFMGGEEHAYQHQPNRPVPFDIKYNGKMFRLTAPLLLQAQEFAQITCDHGTLFNPKVYGDGLIAEMMKVPT